MQYMKKGELAKFKITHPIPHLEMLNQAVIKSCYLAATMFAGYGWARATAPDFVRRIGIGEIASQEFESLVYRFPKLGVELENGFMIGVLSELDIVMLTFPVGREPVYFRGAVLPLADQSIEQYCQNASMFLKRLKKGDNTIEYNECYLVNSNYQITAFHGE